jgi:hypothetical protein
LIKDNIDFKIFEFKISLKKITNQLRKGGVMEPSAHRNLTQQLNNNDGCYEEDHEDAVSQNDVSNLM